MPRPYKPVPKCPRYLEGIIKRVNRLPERDDEIAKELFSLARENNNSPLIEDWAGRKALQKRFEDIIGDEKISNWLIGVVKNKKPILNINKAYVDFASLIQFKRVLRYIAECNRDKNSSGIDRIKRSLWLEDPLDDTYFKIYFTYNYKEGEFKPKLPRLLQALRNKNTALNRISLCPICECIFWAKKTTSETCGEKKCVDNLGNRKRLDKARRLKEKNNDGTL